MSSILEEPLATSKTRFVRRLPWEPLEKALLAHLAAEGIGLKTFCDQHRLCLRSLQRARRQGAISWILGDKVACAMGLHPAAVWWGLW